MNSFIEMGAIYMTAFFMLSGFSLYLVWNKTDLYSIGHIKRFYLKRAIVILPLYYVVALLYILLLGRETIPENLLLAPVEILGLQSTYSSLFSVTHNDGTWFVSCILLVYLIYPFLQEVTKQISVKAKILLILVMSFVLLHSPFIVWHFKTHDTYSNPFFRTLEFFIGVLLCSLYPEIKKLPLSKVLCSGWVFVAENILLVIGVTVAVKMGIPKRYMLYSWLALPVFTAQIFSVTGIKMDAPYFRALIRRLCDISYAFFFAQFFTWTTARRLLTLWGTDALSTT